MRIFSSEIGNGIFTYSLIEDGRMIKTQKNIKGQMKITIFIASFLCFSLVGEAQKQGNVWVFANNNTLNFNTNPPLHTYGGEIFCEDNDACEGVASISDSEGNLLFYSNGVNVWDSEHQIIENGNGLMGHPSSTQSAFILPKPGENTNYYLFTLDAYENQLQNGLRCSEIVLCDKNEGISVVEKNILLHNNVTEKLCVTQHSNNIDYWLLAHEMGTAKFLIYLITESGIDLADSVIIGRPHPTTLTGAVGQMKFSPDGSRLALAVSNTPNPGIELFDFNKTNGIISNPVFFNPDTLEGGPMPFYGLSFSPSSNKLYAAPVYWDKLYQIDLQQGGTPSQLINASTLLNSVTNSTSSIHQIQIGPDGKIYLASNGSNYLNVIAAPDSAGLACNYQINAVDLNGHSSGWGLPAFIDNYNYQASGICGPNGLFESLPHNSIQIYPNPFTNQTTIKLTNPLQNGTLQLHDDLGRLVRNEPIAGNEFTLQQKGLPAGVYFMSIFDGAEKLGSWRVAVGE